jgi:hypothetical protein
MHTFVQPITCNEYLPVVVARGFTNLRSDAVMDFLRRGSERIQPFTRHQNQVWAEAARLRDRHQLAHAESSCRIVARHDQIFLRDPQRLLAQGWL